MVGTDDDPFMAFASVADMDEESSGVQGSGECENDEDGEPWHDEVLCDAGSLVHLSADTCMEFHKGTKGLAVFGSWKIENEKNGTGTSTSYAVAEGLDHSRKHHRRECM